MNIVHEILGFLNNANEKKRDKNVVIRTRVLNNTDDPGKTT